jgi:hypothetical protein
VFQPLKRNQVYLNIASDGQTWCNLTFAPDSTFKKQNSLDSSKTKLGWKYSLNKKK